MNDADLWRELGQQLRVDSIRSAAVTKSGHPTSSMSAADLVRTFLGARFGGGERYLRRLEKIEEMEGRLTHG